MTGPEAALAKSQCESLRRISRDMVDVATSLEATDTFRSVRNLTHPPSMKKAMRTVGVALAVAPEPFTTVVGVGLVAGSFAMKGEPGTLKSIAEELSRQASELSDFASDLSISI